MYEKVTDTPFFAKVQLTDENWILDLFNLRTLKQRETLWYQGERADTLCVIQNGQFTKSFDSESRSVVLSYHKAGDIMGEAEVKHSLRTRYVTTTATTDARVWLLTRPNLDKLLDRHPEVYQQLFDAIGNRFIRAGRKINYLSFMDAFQRISQLLVDHLSDNEGSDEWQITQQEIGHIVNLNRESVARVLNHLQSQNVIRVGRGKVNLISPDNLRKIASRSNSELTYQPFFQGNFTSDDTEVL